MNSDNPFLVFDTSTLISVFLNPHQLPAKVLFHALEHYRVVVSSETKEELIIVTHREKLDRFRSREERLMLLSLYLDVVELIEPTLIVDDCRDPKDNKFLSLARSVNACMLISSDNDLLVLDPYHSTRIVSVRYYAEEHQIH